MLSRHSFRGRRRTLHRRQDDSGAGYVDRVEPFFSLVLGGVFFFHVLDAFFTLVHLQQGATELNPLMRVLLGYHEGWFLGVKLGLAGFGVVFLGIHQNFPMVRGAVAFLFLVFGLLLGYHLVVFAAA
jgi:hypothetical protein